MMRFLFKRLLAANYSFARTWANKKMPDLIIPATLYIFKTPFAFLSAGLYCVVLGSITYRFKSYFPIFIGLGIIMLGIYNIMEKPAKKAIYQWELEKEYKTLSKNQRWSRNTFAFIIFWGSFALSFYLVVKFVGGYLVK